jgi:aspartate-semialdehyde dehydrogenase
MILPEINPGHAQIISAQRKRLGTDRGFIAVKSNCSIQSYVPLLYPLMDYKPVKASVCTYQAISGAGKTFDSWPEMIDNVIPYIGGEDEKSELEPLRVLGTLQNGKIVPASAPVIGAQCIRVPVTDGHMAAVSVSFEKKPCLDDVIERWKNFKGRPQELSLPSAPKQFIHYFDSNDRPQTKSERELERGMAITAGRLRPDAVFDIKFIGLSHNTIRGAAGGAVLMAELLAAEGYII